MNHPYKNNAILTVTDFNNREVSAYSYVYTLYYDELSHFANKLFYHTNIDCDDLLQDIFITLWTKKNIQFESYAHIKNYLYQMIKNKFKDFVEHQKYVRQYELQIKYDEEYLFTQMVEAETLAALNNSLNYLPEECSKVLKLYLDGWDIKDISEKLNKSKSTIYGQKQMAINILKRKLGGKIFTSLIHFISI